MASYKELSEAVVEIGKLLEGYPESLKPQVFKLLIESFLGRTVDSRDDPLAPELPEDAKAGGGASETKGKKKSQRRKASSESYSIDRQLNLKGAKGGQSFKEFYESKAPSSAAEFNAVAAYYLIKMMGLSKVTLNHLFTCYKEVNRKTPDFLRQSVTDTKNKLGYIELDAEGHLKVPLRGENFVEHDLPTKKPQKK